MYIYICTYACVSAYIYIYTYTEERERERELYILYIIIHRKPEQRIDDISLCVYCFHIKIAVSALSCCGGFNNIT